MKKILIIITLLPLITFGIGTDVEKQLLRKKIESFTSDVKKESELDFDKFSIESLCDFKLNLNKNKPAEKESTKFDPGTIDVSFKPLQKYDSDESQDSKTFWRNVKKELSRINGSFSMGVGYVNSSHGDYSYSINSLELQYAVNKNLFLHFRFTHLEDF